MTDKYVIYQIWGAEDDKSGPRVIFSMISKNCVFGHFTVGNPDQEKNMRGGTFSAKNLENNFKFCFLMQFHNGTLDVEYSQSIFSTF